MVGLMLRLSVGGGVVGLMLRLRLELRLRRGGGQF